MQGEPVGVEGLDDDHGVRAEPRESEVAALAERAGLRVRSRRDIGWDHRLRELTPATAST
ncbi:hypothetical protein [Streptomyces antibioticus]|uniref:hypothetical protein n=1 Tax=Streptomyces antibioticus TaxID=1890 RepID=UPI003404582E